MEGGIARLDLPGERGRVYVAFYVPQLLGGGPDPGALLNSRRPDTGLFVAGADVRREAQGTNERVTALYVPSTPRALEDGMPPLVEVRPLGKDGRADLAIFGGRGGRGEDGKLILEDLKRFVGRDYLDAAMMRSWPKDGVLQEALRTIRTEAARLVRDEDWYRALSSDPTGWRTSVVVQQDGTGDPAFAACVADTMAFCPFPAHAREEGAIFVLPLRFE